jgi:pimeloyl-ACP methyl ester carboxylesterase
MGVHIEPYCIDIDERDIEDLRRRIDGTRWPDAVAGAGWDYGADVDYMRDLARYWAAEFDWRCQESKLNEYPQFVAQQPHGALHFFHRPADRQPAPAIVLVHGWPGAFLQMLPLCRELDEFDVVIPALPGFPCSDRPTRPGMGIRTMAAAVNELMATLGYDRYLVHGTDLGTLVAYEMAHARPDAVSGVHVSAAVMPFILGAPDDLTPAEVEFVDRSRIWMLTEMAYALQHGTKPQSLAFGLNDSPIALAAWVVDKLRAWSDCGGDLETAITRDDVLTLLSLYWFTETGGSSIRIYYESVRDGGGHGEPNPRAPIIGPFTPSWSDVPVGVLTAPADMIPMPREWAQRMTRVVRWTELDRGGHFTEWEAPVLVANDIRAFATETGAP